MSLEIIKELNIDFYNSKYISVNTKQYDKSSRYILVTCYNQGNIFPIDNTYNYAFVRYRKPDEKNVFNCCEITKDGKVLIELTEQMLAFVGKCFIDLVIVNNEPLSINSIAINNGELLSNENTRIVSTMLFCVNVIEDTVSNIEIESTDEYNALNELLAKATADYSYIIKMAKVSEDNAKESEINAKASENNAKKSESNAKISEDSAKAYKENAESFKKIAETKADEAWQSANVSAEHSGISVNKAKEALDSAILSESYAVGGTNSRENEDSDNAKYYYTKTKAVSDGLDGSFVPMGTIEYSQLQSVIKDVGYVYHISNSFTTDETFKCGADVWYPSGTNVYYTSDGYWDCFIPKELTGDLTVEDDDNGNVSIIFESNETTITYDEYDKLKQTVLELQAMLGERTILEIVE